MRFIALLLPLACWAQSNNSGNRVNLEPTNKPTFCATANAWTIPAAPTDMWSITGSATKTVRVLNMTITPSQTTAATQTFFLVRRSTADTAGTSAAATIVPSDSAFAAATAIAKSWTANPTLGTLVGNVSIIRVSVPLAVTADPRYPMMVDFTMRGLLPGVVLRGTAQELHLNFNGAALPAGLTLTASWCWAEE
jgi:hypothetical protein